MQNVDVQIQGDKLVIVVDLTQEVGPSASGKSLVIGTTGGNVGVPGSEDIKLGLNVYRPQQAGVVSPRRAGRSRSGW